MILATSRSARLRAIGYSGGSSGTGRLPLRSRIFCAPGEARKARKRFTRAGGDGRVTTSRLLASGYAPEARFSTVGATPFHASATTDLLSVTIWVSEVGPKAPGVRPRMSLQSWFVA